MKQNYRNKRNYSKKSNKNAYVKAVAKSEVQKALSKEIEVKYTDISPPGGGPTTIDRLATTTTYDIFVGARGTDAQTFIGERISPKGFYVRVLLLQKSTVVTGFNQVRIFIVQNRDAVDFSASQILRDTGADFNPIISQYSRDFQARYRMLYDKVFVLHTDNKECQYINIKIPAKRLSQIRYTNAGSVERGKIRMYAVSNTNTAGSEPTITWTGRLYYTDA